MIRNKFRMFILGFTSMSLLAACGGETGSGDAGSADADMESGGELRIAYSAQPPVLDPQEAMSIAVSDIMRHVFEPLVTMDSEYNIQPMLAESFEQSDDGSEITFELREGVQFHNGQEMTSADVEASLNKWLAAPGSRDQYHEDAHAEAVDDYTVVLHLQEALSTALPQLASNSVGFPTIMPEEIVEEADASGVNEYVGTGPFVFEEWREDQYVHLSKFDDYQPRDEEPDGLAGRREALVDDVYFEFILDSSTRVSGMQTGQYDIAHAVPFDLADQLEADGSLENYTYPGGFLSIHFNKREGFFTDQDARQALAASINKESIMLGAYTSEEYYVMDNNMMMHHQLGQWDSEVGSDTYSLNDESRIEAYLDDIDYSGEEITIITTRDYDDQYNGAVVLQEQMEQMGMNVNLEVYDWSTLLELNQDASAYDIFIMGNTAVPEPSSNNFFDPNYPGWTEAPEVVHEFRSLPSLDEGAELYDELQEWFWDYVPMIKIGNFNRVATTQNNIDNFQYQDGFILWNLSKSEESGE